MVLSEFCLSSQEKYYQGSFVVKIHSYIGRRASWWLVWLFFSEHTVHSNPLMKTWRWANRPWALCVSSAYPCQGLYSRHISSYEVVAGLFLAHALELGRGKLQPLLNVCHLRVLMVRPTVKHSLSFVSLTPLRVKPNAQSHVLMWTDEQKKSLLLLISVTQWVEAFPELSYHHELIK